MPLGALPRRRGELGAQAAEGLLEMTATVAPDGHTYLSRRRQRFPLRLTAPLYLDLRVPGMAFLYVQNPTGGVFEDDELRLALQVDASARVHLTTQAATKVYRCPEGCARQRIDLAVAAGAFAEYIPDPLIPHQGARFEQTVHADVEPGGVLLAAELVTPGRVAHHESFAYTRLSLTTRIRVSEREAAVDAIVLEPHKRDPRVPGVLGEHTYLASLFVVAPDQDPDDLAHAIRAAADTPDCLLSTGTLPGGAGVLTRLLARSGIAADRALRAAWTAARVRLLGATPPRRRK
jgi:urease accessory protein